MNTGKFITFEGNDGCGKTTIIKLIYEALLNKGYDVVLTREPGGIEIAEQIREVILNPNNTKMDGRTEALLYAASRRQHLVERVLPAYNRGSIIICDRFIDSSLAYQGIARNLGIDEVLNLNEFAINGFMPDLTILLKVSCSVGLSRLSGRDKQDRLDIEGDSFHKLVSQGYDIVADRFKDRIKVVNAEQDIDSVLNDTLKIVMDIINE